MKRRWAAALAAMALLAGVLSGCVLSDEQRLVGTWETTLELADQVNQETAGMEVGEYIHLDSLPVVVRFTFSEDGSYTSSVDREAFEGAMEGCRADIRRGFIRYAQDVIADQELQMEVEALLEALGTSLDRLVDAAITEEGMEELLRSCRMEGNYMAAEGRLALSHSRDAVPDMNIYYPYSISRDGRELTLGEPSDGKGERFAGQYPMVLTKVDQADT